MGGITLKILLIGGTGTIGRAVRKEMEMEMEYEIITASRTGSDITVDITSRQSIQQMYESVGRVDAVVSTTGSTYFGSLLELTPENNEISISSKLKGQINLVLCGLNHVHDHGSFTLTTGIVMDQPIIGGASAAMVGGAIKTFVKSAAIEMPRGIRINNVSPNILIESVEKYGPFFPGFDPVPARRVAVAYRKSVEGSQSGETFTVY
jgi:NAD(P)-dependent dehydrogenase (short-subunit alcohol dehydrogenase family)